MESSLEFSNSLGSVSSLLTRYRTFKVLMIGDSGVGKTCLTHRICGGQFPSRVEATIGVDFRERLDIDGEKIKLQLWDTAGQERFRKSMVQHYYRNVHAVLFIYDVICPGSFNGLIAWIEECRQNSLGQDIPRHTGNIRTHTSSPAADNTVNMFSRRAWQRVGPLARRAFRFVSGNAAPVRQMAFRLPGHTTNKTYILLCGGGLTAAVVYAYKTVRGDSECYKGKAANMGSAAKAPAAETTPIKEAAEVISKSSPTPAEPVAEAATEPVIEVASEEAATMASEVVVTEEAVPLVVGQAAPEAAPVATVPSEALAAESTGMAAVDEVPPTPPTEAETTPTAPEAASEVVVTEEAVPLIVGEAAPEAAPVATVPSEALAAESGGTAAVDEAPPTPPTEAETAPTAPEAADVSAAEVAA